MNSSWSVVVVLLLGEGLVGDVPAVRADAGLRERSFVRALELFDAAKTPDDYRESASVLESILADGFRSGAVYYNLGNAYFRAGEFGRAILNYRKAKPYLPRDPYLAANLQQALAVAPGRLSAPPRPWWTHVLFWTDWISYPTKVRAAFMAVNFAAVSAIAAVALRRSRIQLLTVGLIVVSSVLAADAALCHVDTTDSYRGVITRETVARKGMGSSYEPAFDQPLQDGAEFTVLNETPDWVFGHFESVGDGWVRKDATAR